MALIFIHILHSTKKQEQDSFRPERISEALIIAHLLYSWM